MTFDFRSLISEFCEEKCYFYFSGGPNCLPDPPFGHLKASLSVWRRCQNVVLRQKHEAVLSDFSNSDQIATLLEVNQPLVPSAVLSLAVVQCHLSPPATGLPVDIPQPDHQNHAQPDRAAQQHAQLPGTVSGNNVRILSFFVRSVSGIWGMLCFGIRVLNVWFDLLVMIWSEVGIRFGVWMDHLSVCRWGESSLRVWCMVGLGYQLLI